MSRFILFCLIAAATSSSFAQPLLPAEQRPADAAPAEMTPEQRMTQFRRDQINLLALHGDTPSLLSAALLAQSDANDPKRPNALKSPSLVAHAQRTGPDDVSVWWTAASIECRDRPKDCPQVETLQKLEALDAQNAAVWVFSLMRAQNSGDQTGARAALTSAAQSQRYDDYFGKTMAMLEDAEHILPVSDEVIRASGQLNASVEGFQLVNAAGVAVRAMPPLAAAVSSACRDGTAGSDLNSDCIAIAKKMVASGSLGAKNAGLSVLIALFPAGADQNAARDQLRALTWQTMRIGEQAEQLADDQRITRIYATALHASGTEAAAVVAVLRSQGVAMDPPADWRAPEPDAPPRP
ncbi:MAG: hypothetical protein ABJB01_09475 [Rudaea sp.]